MWFLRSQCSGVSVGASGPRNHKHLALSCWKVSSWTESGSHVPVFSTSPTSREGSVFISALFNLSKNPAEPWSILDFLRPGHQAAFNKTPGWVSQTPLPLDVSIHQPHPAPWLHTPLPRLFSEVNPISAPPEGLTVDPHTYHHGPPLKKVCLSML